MTEQKEVELSKVPENLDELIQCQKELKEEEEMLSSMIAKIDKQIHALQVERLHLLNTIYENKSETDDANIAEETEVKPDIKSQLKIENNDQPDLNIDLNLNIASVYQYCDEEEEDDDDDEENEEDYIM